MARSLLANAFFLGSLFVAGTLAQQDQVTPSEAFTALRDTSADLAHAKQNQTVACAPPPEELSKAEKRKLKAECKTANRKVGQLTKEQKRAQANLKRAMSSANKQCRAEVASETKQCKKDCRAKLGKAFVASRDGNGNCECSCKKGFHVPDGKEKCEKAKVALPRTAPAVRPCCEAGPRKGNAALWRASYPSDAIDSGMPGIVSTPTSEQSRITTVCDQEKRRNGGFAVRHELHRGDPIVGNSVRSESHTMHHHDSLIKKGQTRYYGMSLYFGPDWELNKDEATNGVWNADILFQWKAFGCDESFKQCPGAKYPSFDSCSNCLSSEQQGKGDYPFMTIQQKRQGLVLRISDNVNGNLKEVTADGKTINQQDQITITNTISRSEWHDIKMKVVWDDEPSTDPAKAKGSIKIWHKLRSEADYGEPVPVYYSSHKRHIDQATGKPTTEWTGPTMYGNHKGYLKWGLYEPHWKPSADKPPAAGPHNRTVYHDNIAVGDCLRSVDPAAVDCEDSEQQCGDDDQQ